jgi:hypothetical protein
MAVRDRVESLARKGRAWEETIAHECSAGGIVYDCIERVRDRKRKMALEGVKGSGFGRECGNDGSEAWETKDKRVVDEDNVVELPVSRVQPSRFYCEARSGITDATDVRIEWVHALLLPPTRQRLTEA